MTHWYRKQLEDLYGPEFLQKMDEATIRLEAKNSPSCGPTGECPKCGGALVYLLRQKVHYCDMCDIEYKEVDVYGKPVKDNVRRLG